LSQLSERQKEKKRINESIAGDVFIDTYGMTQKREKLKNAVTVRDFRVFDLSYRRNFQYLMRKVEALVIVFFSNITYRVFHLSGYTNYFKKH